MDRRIATGFAALALLAGPALTGVPVAAAAAQAQPAPSRLPSIVEQTITRVQAAQRSAGLAQEPASLSNDVVHVDPAGRIELAFHATAATGAAEEASLAGLGATGIYSLQLPKSLGIANVGLVQAFVPAANAAAAAALPWVAAVTTPSYGARDVGSVTSEGVAFHGADIAQAQGNDGTGVNVGVISDGVSNIAASQASGDLPNTVNVLNAGSGDEGTAMLEIVRDMAPGAGLLFDATGATVATHVAAMNNLVTNGANVIAEDIPFDAEPAFQVGLAAQTAENIAAAGVSVHSSAGNLGSTHAARVAAVGTGQRPDNTANTFTGCANTPDNVVDIDPGAGTAFDVTVAPTTPPAPNNTLSVTLQWSEPRAIFPTVGRGGFTDLNLYVMNQALTQCLAQSTTVQANGQGDTLEQVSVALPQGTNVKLVVDVQGTSTATAAPTLDLRWRNGNANDTTTRAGSLNPDSNYTGQATSAAAVNAVSGNIEGFSGGGPVQLGATTICPGGAAGPCTGVAGGGLASSPGPTWAAADGVQVTGAGGFSSPFFGTSAAAPHAAACDALVRQLQPTFTVAQVTNRLKAGAVDLPPPGVDNITGAGRLVCVTAQTTVATMAASSVFTATSGPPIIDTANLTGGFNPTGTVTFRAFGPNNATCAGAAAFTSVKTVNGNGSYASGPFVAVAEGAYRWVVTYSGDADNLTFTSPCNAANETSTVFSICAAPPPPGTLPGNTIVIAAPGLVTTGTAGDDVIYGTAGNDRIDASGGNDIVFAGDGADQVIGGDGNDTLCGGNGADNLLGNAGNDLLVGGTGNDDLAGSAGNDRLIGGADKDRLTGGDDVDVCTPGTDPASQTTACETVIPPV